MARKARGYHFDIRTNTLTVSNQFAENAYIPDTTEYGIYKQLREDFPKMRIVRMPERRKNGNGLTYEKMERYIGVYSNANELLPHFSDSQKDCLYTEEPLPLYQELVYEAVPQFL